MHVCIYIYIYIYTAICVYTCVCVCVYVYIYIYIYSRKHGFYITRNRYKVWKSLAHKDTSDPLHLYLQDESGFKGLRVLAFGVFRLQGSEFRVPAHSVQVHSVCGQLWAPSGRVQLETCLKNQRS